MPRIRLEHAEGDCVFDLPRDGNVLEAAIAAAAPLGYTCKAGRCCQCQVKVLAGAGQLSPPTAAEHARLGHDKLKRSWRLACQARVRGGEVVLGRLDGGRPLTSPPDAQGGK